MGRSERPLCITRSKRALAFWGGVVIGIPVVIDVVADRHAPHLTFSNTHRSWMWGDTLLGETIIIGTWAYLTKWYMPHIIRPAREVRLARAVAARLTATK